MRTAWCVVALFIHVTFTFGAAEVDDELKLVETVRLRSLTHVLGDPIGTLERTTNGEIAVQFYASEPSGVSGSEIVARTLDQDLKPIIHASWAAPGGGPGVVGTAALLNSGEFYVGWSTDRGWWNGTAAIDGPGGDAHVTLVNAKAEVTTRLISTNGNHQPRFTVLLPTEDAVSVFTRHQSNVVSARMSRDGAVLWTNIFSWPTPLVDAVQFGISNVAYLGWSEQIQSNIVRIIDANGALLAEAAFSSASAPRMVADGDHIVVAAGSTAWRLDAGGTIVDEQAIPAMEVVTLLFRHDDGTFVLGSNNGMAFKLNALLETQWTRQFPRVPTNPVGQHPGTSFFPAPLVKGLRAIEASTGPGTVVNSEGEMDRGERIIGMHHISAASQTGYDFSYSGRPATPFTHHMRLDALLVPKLMPMIHPVDAETISETNFAYASPKGSFAIKSGVPQARIFYTLDGSDPSSNSVAYTAGSLITISNAATVRAIAYSPATTNTLQSAPTLLQFLDLVPFELLGPGHLTKLRFQSAGGRTTWQNEPPARYDATLAGGTLVEMDIYKTRDGMTLRTEGDLVTNGWHVAHEINQPTRIRAIVSRPLMPTVIGEGGIVPEKDPRLLPLGLNRLHAAPASGYYFSKWSAPDPASLSSATNNPTVVNIGAFNNPAVTAEFLPLPANSASVTAGAYGPGEVLISPQKAFYTIGEVVEIQAVPSPGAAFLGWMESGITNQTFQLQVTGNTRVNGRFAGFTAGTFVAAVESSPEAMTEVHAATNANGPWKLISSRMNTGLIFYFEDVFAGPGGRFYKVVAKPLLPSASE